MKKSNLNGTVAKQNLYKKPTHTVKEFVPTLNISNCREQCPIKSPDSFIREFSTLIEPNDVLPEWPGDEIALNFDYGLLSEEIFIDPENEFIVLPYSLRVETMNEVNWCRPDTFVREYLLEKQLKEKMPNKNPIELREKLRENYRKRSQDQEKEKEKENEKERSIERSHKKKYNSILVVAEETENIFREVRYLSQFNNEYFRFYKMNLDLQVVNYSEREETEAEFKMRREEAERKFKEQIEVKTAALLPNQKRSMKNDPSQYIMPELTPVKKIDILPSNILMAGNYCKYSKWVASAFQVILDMKIPDANINCESSFIQKIYPQKNGIPVVNPSGRYWVKLYHMGKYRKVEIDDQMPCGKNFDFLLPHCDNIQELWPALLTKALMKLYSYKYRNTAYDYEETGDCSIFYSLIGYIGEKIYPALYANLLPQDDDDNKDSKMQSMAEAILNDERYTKKMKFLIGYYRTEEDHISPYELKLFSLEQEKRKGNKKRYSCGQLTEKKIIEKRKSKFALVLGEESTNLENNNPTSPKENRNEDKKEIIISPDNMQKLPDIIHSPNEPKEIPTSDSNSGGVKKSGYEKFKEDVKKKFATRKSILNSPKSKKVGEQIFLDFAYAIVEIFSSDTFNMKRLRPIDFSDLKLNPNAKYKHMPRDEKKAYIRQLRVLKSTQKSEKQKRLDELKILGTNFYMLKIKSNINININISVSNNPMTLDFNPSYNDEEIEMAKMCIMNNWTYPPIEFFEHTFGQEKKISKQGTVNEEEKKIFQSPLAHNLPRLMQHGLMNSPGSEIPFWTKDLYQEIIKDEWEKYTTTKPSLQREEGAWMELKKFASMFNVFIVLHNPKFYHRILFCNNLWTNYERDLYQPLEEMRVFHLIPGKSSYINTKFQSSKAKSCVLILLESNTSKGIQIQARANNEVNRKKRISCSGMLESLHQSTFVYDEVDYSLNFELFDQNQQFLRDISLKNFFSVHQVDELDPECEYFLLCKGGVVPFGYYLTLLSDHKIEHMSLNSYLKIHRKLSYESFPIVMSSMEKGEYYVTCRFKSTFPEDFISNKKFYVSFSIARITDCYLRQFFQMYLITSNSSWKKIQFNERIPVGMESISSYVSFIYIYEIIVHLICYPTFQHSRREL